MGEVHLKLAVGAFLAVSLSVLVIARVGHVSYAWLAAVAAAGVASLGTFQVGRRFVARDRHLRFSVPSLTAIFTVIWIGLFVAAFVLLFGPSMVRGAAP